ncbi:MAG: hypothetical protein WA869_28495 [Alloacidobacterium sp.]|jgi:hypothetical protein
MIDEMDQRAASPEEEHDRLPKELIDEIANRVYDLLRKDLQSVVARGERVGDFS